MENTKTATEAPKFIFADRFAITDEANTEFYNHLLRGLTHKLNNLLAVIQGFSSLIMMDDGLEQTVVENLTHMKEAAQNASGLSERILPAGGCCKCSLQSLKLQDYLPMIDNALREPFARANVPFQMNVPAEMPAVNADPGRIKEILMELLTNAAEAAAPNGGEVALDILNPGQASPAESRRLDIFVRNTGSQINMEKVEQIFQPFYSTKDSSHFGVGLTTAAVLSKQMGMRLGVNSEHNTTTFWLSVPLI